MSQENDFSTLMQQLREGSESAFEELVTHYGDHILRVVRGRINKKLRPRFDSQDFVQAVWASFFAFLPERYSFEQPEELVAVLTKMARHKVVEAIRRRLLYKKENINRECSLDETLTPLCTTQPAPDRVAMARDEWQKLLESQPDRLRQILLLLGRGDRKKEVAHKLGMSEKTVSRLVQNISRQPADDQR